MNPEIMKQAGFQKEIENVKNGMCLFCVLPVNINEFRDQISLKEFQISGLCQKCQDETFGK